MYTKLIDFVRVIFIVIEQKNIHKNSRANVYIYVTKPSQFFEEV
jgi:hypothetical protein